MDAWTALRRAAFVRDDYTCQYCHWRPKDNDDLYREVWRGWRSPSLHLKLHGDHIIPLSLGGENRIENVVTACWQCNLAKGPRLWRVPIAYCAKCGRYERHPDESKLDVELDITLGYPCFICDPCQDEIDYPLDATLAVSDIDLEVAQWDALAEKAGV